MEGESHRQDSYLIDSASPMTVPLVRHSKTISNALLQSLRATEISIRPIAWKTFQKAIFKRQLIPLKQNALDWFD